MHDTAEEAVKNYKYDGALYLNQVNFTNVNDMEGMANMTEYSHHFKQDINNETSGVHVPIEIYEGCKYHLTIFHGKMVVWHRSHVTPQ